jgi:hypothetical protein
MRGGLEKNTPPSLSVVCYKETGCTRSFTQKTTARSMLCAGKYMARPRVRGSRRTAVGERGAKVQGAWFGTCSSSSSSSVSASIDATDWNPSDSLNVDGIPDMTTGVRRWCPSRGSDTRENCNVGERGLVGMLVPFFPQIGERSSFFNKRMPRTIAKERCNARPVRYDG